MTFFVDANVIVYAVTPGPRRDPALDLLAAVSEGAGKGTTSVAVLEEVWHLELSGRIPDLAGQTRRARSIFGDLLAVTPGTLDIALALEAPPELGANDRLHVASCVENEIVTIVSADRSFDAIATVERIDPLDREALEPLLASS